MAALIALSSLPAFKNEPYTDFSVPENRGAMEHALDTVRRQFGREYPLLIAGERMETGDTLISRNPSRPEEIVGIHHKANAGLARLAVEQAYKNFPAWRDTPAEDRLSMLLSAAALLRQRKLEFDAWLVFEAGKTWPEAEAETAEAIDFCEYYARQMLRFRETDAEVQMPGERDRIRYVPLGVGVVIPPWNFALAILAGMTTAALVTGNTVVLKPSSETPTIAAKFAELLLEAGFPPFSFSLLVGSGAEVGDVIVEHPKTRFVSFTGSRDVGLRINELAAKPRKGQLWIKRVIAEMGGKDAIIVDREADLDKAVAGVVQSAFGYQGQKCSACSRAIVDEAIYDDFLARLGERVREIKVGPADEPDSYMGPVISEKAKKNILDYIETGSEEGRVLCGADSAPTEGGYFIQPTVIADVERNACVFREEIFGPVLAVTKARDFDEALELANDSEYGLTGAVYTNNPEKVRKARDQFFVGNLYINRKCTGAMVGAHPFGGFNMSGTDSKAGGPDYLLQFLQAKSIAEKVD
ncbi:MAG TPA: L-glutamate gamma-semialdehyde dehydrogenase [Bryobacteraceae bacterium]|nr:L-glutamate gamma-semialdehyde dehydrogenase [Bryobacteraceae bacterium]